MFEAIKGRGGLKLVPDEGLWAYINHGTRALPDGSVTLKCSPMAEAAMFDAVTDPDEVWTAVAKLKFPTMLVYSESRKVPELWAQHGPVVKKFTELSGARFVVTPGTHNTATEYPDHHAKLILDFTDELERAGRLPAQSMK
jgi:hypothetical protein